MEDKIKAILFDLDDTLFDASGLAEKARRAAIESMIEKGLSGIDAEKGYEILLEVVQEYGSNASNHFDMFLKRLDSYSTKLVSAAVITYHKIKIQEIQLFPDVFNFLQKITNMTSCKLAIVTDGIPIKQYEKILRLGLDNFFKIVIISDEIGIRKPNPQLFRHALEVVGVEPANALYIGDRFDRDIYPAKKVGMKTCFVHRGGKYDEVLDEEAMSSIDFQVKDLNELWPLISEHVQSK